MTSLCNSINYYTKIGLGEINYYSRINCTETIYSSLAPHDQSQVLRICAISDTHGDHEFLGVLPPCDILICCGNILNESKNIDEDRAKYELQLFNMWLGTQKATHKIVIGGNHDQKLEDLQAKILVAGIQSQVFTNATYLCNSNIVIDGLNIVGIPFSVRDSANQGFQSREAAKQTEDYLNYLIEKETKVDILITHGPCENIGTMLKPRIAHFSGRNKAKYGITRVMHAPMEIEIINHRNRSAKKKNPENDLYCYNICPTIHTVDYVPANLPIVFDIERPVSTKGKNGANYDGVGNNAQCCVIC